MFKKNLSTFIYAILFCFIVIGIIAYPNEGLQAAGEGLKLWFNVVCPALLPFFICVDILIGLGIVSFIGAIFKPIMLPIFRIPGEASFAFFMSMSSGYPVGAKIIVKMRQDKICSRIEGQRMLSLCSTSGPLFIAGAVATGILKHPELGTLLMTSHYLSALAAGLSMRFYGKSPFRPASFSMINPFREMIRYKTADGRTIGTLLGDAVKNGVNLILLIGGFIIFFSVVTRIMQISGLLTMLSHFICLIFNALFPFLRLSEKSISGLLVGVLEVTNGINACAPLTIPLIHKVMLISFMLGFGGLSINAQVLSIMGNTDLKFSIYFLMKICQGFFAMIFSFFLFKLGDYLPAFNTLSGSQIPAQPILTLGWFRIMADSMLNLFYMLLLLLMTGIIAFGCLRFKKKSQVP